VSDEPTGASAPATHWRRRSRNNPIPPDQAIRQGNVTRLAFEMLGREQAIAFLNEHNAVIGGRPIAIATASAAGALAVEAELGRIHERQTGQR
jgi:uncharacterized protein (DUF2384 family)